MIIYDGTYRLKSDSQPDQTPRSQWLCAWQIRIINFGLGQPVVRHLKPLAVVAKQCGKQRCLGSCAESIGKRISRDFNLNVHQVLWIEHFANAPGKWLVASFKSKSSFGPDINYSINWRPIRLNEIEVIKPYIPDFDEL